MKGRMREGRSREEERQTERERETGEQRDRDRKREQTQQLLLHFIKWLLSLLPIPRKASWWMDNERGSIGDHCAT